MTKIFFSLFIILSLVHLSTSCIHDKLNVTLEMDPPSASGDRKLAAGDRQSMRIHTTYYIASAPLDVKKVIQQQLMPAAVAYYQAALKVNRLTEPITVTDQRASICASVSSTEELRNGVDADLVLLITGLNEPEEGYIAYAKSCAQDSSGRPKIGMIHFNYAYSFDKTSYYNYQAQQYTTLHELGHVLGFSKFLYPYFINPATGNAFGQSSPPTITRTVNDKSITILTIEPLRTKLATYFNCPNIEGAYLENEGDTGSAGSHFERRVFYNEFMTASDIADPRVSEFYLALLEGSGWYTPDYTMAEPMFWGKGKGCNFLRTPCLNTQKQATYTDHFCNTLGVDSCSFGAQSYGVCGRRTARTKSDLDPAFNYWGDNSVILDSFADNCPFYQFIPSTECRDKDNSGFNFPTGEYFGEESSCFTGTLGVQNPLVSASPLCLKKTCKKVSTNQYNVLIEINGRTVTCTQQQTVTVPGYVGTLNCPNPNDFCATSGLAYCPRGCNGRGTCTNNACVCLQGFYGSDCSYRNVDGEGDPKSEEGPDKAAIGAGAGVGGGVLILIIGFIIAKIKAWQAGGAAGAFAAGSGGDAKVVGQGIQTTTHFQNQPGQNDGPVELNMEGYY